MKTERWRQVDELLQSALDRPTLERPAFLEQACGADDSLKREVEILLTAYEESGSFIEQPLGDVDVVNTGSLVSGQILGQYKIVRQIGAGGMGQVYLATDTRTNRQVALKLLPSYFLHDEQHLRRFQQEARAVLALNHPNIITVYEIGSDNGRQFIATEFIEGETLRARLDRKMEISDALEVGVQVAAALSFAHEHGVIHRDIKPENVMLRPDGYAKVLDFGIAKLNERGNESPSQDLTAKNKTPSRVEIKTAPGLVMGTANYMSPEQARGVGVDQRTDIWSLGVVLHEMITGRPPFDGETTSDIVSLILQRDPPRVSEFIDDAPSELQRILEKALDKRKDHRYQTAQDLLADLRRLKLRYEVDGSAELQRNASSGVNGKSSVLPTHSSSGNPASLDSAVNQSKRHKKALTLALLALFITMTIWLFWYLPRSRKPVAAPATVKTIAVLPFSSLVPEQADRSLELGMADALISKLSNVRALTVRPTSSVLKYGSGSFDVRAVGSELGVEAVLEGKVQKAGDRVRVSVQLVRASDAVPLWAERFDEKFTDIFALQDDISDRVTSALALRLSVDEKRGLAKRYTDNVEAYELYLRGRDQWRTFQRPALLASLNYYNEALKKDPNYALAYAGLANSYSVISTYGPLPAREVVPKGIEAADKAVALDDNLAEAHAARGAYRIFAERDWLGAEKELKKAMELDPNNNEAATLYAYCLEALGRMDESVEMFQRAKDLAPQWFLAANDYLGALYDSRRYDQAIEQSRKILTLEPENSWASYILGCALAAKGQNVEAIAALERAVEVKKGPAPKPLSHLGYVYARTGRREDALKIINRLLAEPSPWLSMQLARVYTGLGEKQKAIDSLEQAEADLFPFAYAIKYLPEFDTLRSEPRFTALLRRMNLSP